MNAQDLAHLIPLSDLSSAALTQACALARPFIAEPGQLVFPQKSADAHSYYLLSGEVALDREDGSEPTRLSAGTPAARHPLARQKPRAFSCRAMCRSLLVVFGDDDLDHLLTRDQATAYEVTEFEGDDPQWMFDVLRNPAFSKVPPGNLHRLFGRFEPLPVAAGQVVVRQGEPGDHYYLIRSGSARVSRRSGEQKEIALAELSAGQGFGEEALLSGEPRNATVTMSSAGELMRLPAADFNALLRDPLVRQVTLIEGARLIKQGARLIDVRLEAEFAAGSLKGSCNIPLYLLRLKADSLDRRVPCILFCQSGRRSNAAAFLLAQRGFDARVLSGGLDALDGTA